MTHRIRLWSVACVLSALLSSSVVAQECKQAFDIGSSGVRVVESGREQSAEIQIDFLPQVWSTGALTPVIPQTAKALKSLPEKAGLSTGGCRGVAGGFSAWRLAFESNPSSLVSDLSTLFAQTGVAVFVIPQAIEGQYALISAKKQSAQVGAGDYILDIGGGSFQLASERNVAGAALGQRSWLRTVCQKGMRMSGDVCDVSPSNPDTIALVRQLIQKELKSNPSAGFAVESSAKVIAVSRPVVKGIYPLLTQLSGQAAKNHIFRDDLSAAINAIQSFSVKDISERFGIAERFAGRVLSDMLLLEGILFHFQIPVLAMLDVNINNAPGLMEDKNLDLYFSQYACYLKRLSSETMDTAYQYDASRCLN